MRQFPVVRYDDEKQPQQDVTDVGIDVVEIAEEAERMGAQEVVKTQILLPGFIQNLGEENTNYIFKRRQTKRIAYSLIGDDELHHGQPVKNRHGQDVVQIQVRLPLQHPRILPGQVGQVRIAAAQPHLLHGLDLAHDVVFGLVERDAVQRRFRT